MQNLFAIPYLLALNIVDNIQKVGTGCVYSCALQGAKIGNGESFLGWSGKVEIAERHMSNFCKAFRLVEFQTSGLLPGLYFFGSGCEFFCKGGNA